MCILTGMVPLKTYKSFIYKSFSRTSGKTEKCKHFVLADLFSLKVQCVGFGGI